MLAKNTIGFIVWYIHTVDYFMHGVGEAIYLICILRARRVHALVCIISIIYLLRIRLVLPSYVFSMHTTVATSSYYSRSTNRSTTLE